MIYPPQGVAEAILYAAANPTRDMFIGSQAKLLALLVGISPRFVDFLMLKTMFRSQHADRPSRARDDNALYVPGYGLQETGTQQGSIYRTRSWYVKASKHPGVCAMLLTASALVIWKAKKSGL